MNALDSFSFLYTGVFQWYHTGRSWQGVIPTTPPHSFLSSLPLRLLWRICDLYWRIEWSTKKTENYISLSWKITQQQNSIEISQKFDFLFYARLHLLFFFLWLVFLVYICQMILSLLVLFLFIFITHFI